MGAGPHRANLCRLCRAGRDRRCFRRAQ